MPPTHPQIPRIPHRLAQNRQGDVTDHDTASAWLTWTLSRVPRLRQHSRFHIHILHISLRNFESRNGRNVPGAEDARYFVLFDFVDVLALSCLL